MQTWPVQVWPKPSGKGALLNLPFPLIIHLLDVSAINSPLAKNRYQTIPKLLFPIQNLNLFNKIL